MVELGLNVRWWEKDAPDRVGRLVSAVRAIKEGDVGRMEDAILHSRMYGENSAFGYEFKTLPRRSSLTMNVVRSTVDSVVARIVKNKPRPQFQTTGGNRSLRRKAKNLTQYVDWAMEEGKANNAFRDAFLDASVTGTGFVHVFTEGTKTCFERIFPSEILVDQQEGMYKQPRTMYRQKWVPKDALKALFPNKGMEIDFADPPSADATNDLLTKRTDLVVVYEAWRLPSKAGAKDGCHMIATSKGILSEEKWVHDSFPLIVIRYRDALSGYWGLGIADNLKGIQIELNKNLIKRQKILDFHATPRVFYEGRTPKRVQLNNSIGMVYQGKPPSLWNPPSVPPELDNYLEMLWVRAHTLEGLSPVEASGTIPAGLNSGVAIQEYDAVVDGKFALPHQKYQDAWLEAANWVVTLGKGIHKKHPKWSPVAAHDKYTVGTVRWDDLDLEKDDYVLRALPASSLPTHPGARLQRVMDMFQTGLISDIAEARRLLDYPDIEAASALDRAHSDYLDWVAEKILDDGVMVAPEPFQDHQLALKRMQAEYHKAVMEEVPSDRLSLLIDFMSATRDAIKAQQAEQASLMAPASTGAPAPTGFGGAPPTAVQPGDTPIPN